MNCLARAILQQEGGVIAKLLRALVEGEEEVGKRSFNR